MNVSLETGALGAFLAIGLSATLGAQGVFTNLGNGSAYSVSDDGSVVAIKDGGTFRWTAAGGRVQIRPNEGQGGFVSMSADGSLVVADIPDVNGDTVAGLWSSALGWASLGYLPNAPCGNSGSSAYDISADGSIVVGLSWDGCQGRAFQWDAQNLMVELPTLGPNSARANTISGDGAVVGGWDEATWGGRRACAWFPGGAQVLMIPPTANDPDGIGEVWDINSNGSVIVGGEGLNGLQPFRWTTAGGYQRLGWIAGVNFDPPFAYATNEDGSVVGGGFGDFFASVAFLWTEEDGMRRFDEVLADQGITVPAVGTLSYVFDISPDGRTIVGRRTPSQFQSAAFRVKMPEGVRYGVRVGGNNTLGLSGTGSTQIGGNLVVTTSNVNAPSVFTVIGLKSTRLPLLGGTLLVDLSLPHLVWNSPVVSGTAAFSFTMPNNPALVGASLYLQSVVLGQPISFSNGIKATITA